MIKTIKLDGKNNYLIDSSTNSIVDKYDPENKNLQLRIDLDDNELIVDSYKIIIEYGNQLVVQYNDDKFIIDDGYQNILTKAGYIVYKNYDEDNIYDKQIGIKTRDLIFKNVETSIMNIAENYNDIIGNIQSIGDDEYIIDGESASYKITIVFDTIASVVDKNQLRKDNSLPFYPFSKGMDKFGTIYVSIFAEMQRKLSEEEVNIKYQISDAVIKDLLNDLGPDYHFIPQQIKRRVIKAKGL